MAVYHFDTEKLIDICRINDIEFLGLFGSFSRGEATISSDVDLIARFSKRKGLLDIVRIEREMSESLGKRVDLLTEAAISPYLIDQIKKETAIIYEV